MIVANFDGIEELEHSVTALGARMKPAPLAGFLDREVDLYLRNRIAHRFAVEGDAASGKWKQLTAATQRFRAYHGFPAAHPINVRTGALKAWAIGTRVIRHESHGATIMKPAPGNWVLEKKLKAAQKGGTTKRGRRFPARPINAVEPGDSFFVSSRLARYFEEGFRLGV